MPNTEVKYVRVWANVTSITQEAVRLMSEATGQYHWVPKSCLSQRTLDELSIGNAVWEMQVAEWFALRNDIE